MLLKNFFGHLHTVGRHRRLVRKYCFRLGLYRQGLMHDLSKYSPTEFGPGVRYYTGKKSPNAGERDEYGFSTAWMHHKGRNRHHFEYWTDYVGPDKEMVGVPMPVNYFCEMFCDRVAASRIYNGDAYTDAMPLEYYYRSREYRLMHKDTRELLEKLLVMLKDEGEDKTFEYVKKEILKR
ncbi:MAG: catalase [Lachnospiraceae bacterium]|nr:catalase [Lachnospiraceae bacterium]MBP5183923.1 catalase [Lachnospiraceae bacterium]